MLPQLNDLQSIGGVQTTAQNRVLRNTYFMLAATMVPTVLGAWIGMSMGFSLFEGSPLISMMLFMGIAFAFFYGIERTKHSTVGVYLLLGFTFFMGLMLSRILSAALGMGNGGQIIAVAAGGTGVIFFGMASLATVVKKDLSSMSKFLFLGVILLIVASVANIWLQMPALMLTISLLAVVIFSVFLLVDLQRIINGGETNYISATLSVYLSVYNIFTNLVVLLMSLFGGGSRD
ncbi:MAG: Bax inhibitor-1 family protein [Proteobacteria bacterium]|nr:Bax inhibitor-1 family protein [Pseudomonadota bacterium]MDA0847130.1 Bax inhibitor-1 family protein [Pseudomonadota bacterium]